jgi:serine/threonine protein kinase
LTQQELETLAGLLEEALEISPEHHEAWLEQLAEPYARLRPTLRDLLKRHRRSETDDFLSTLPKFSDWNDVAAVQQPDDSLQHGALIAGYRLIREIATGGMSSVWLAESSEGIKRRVALKLPFVYRHRPGDAQRFVRERDILAALTHPRIARLYDAGISAQGQPFLAMEFVEGTSVIEHCDAKRMGVRERLRLFMQVLEAVQYAHAHLVVHRDIKPSNILVTAGDEVTLLDFGIAKLVVDGLARETELTQFGGRALTPSYASPEQIAGEPLTTASDTYSLGVVLYELMTGALPYKIQRESRLALEEAILAVEPPRLSQMASSATCAANRGTSVRKLTSTLKGDLDTIALKALRKSAAQRYLTAQAFAEDIERYLADQPVLAQADSALYRIGKFFRRNKLMVGVTGSIAATLVVGFGTAVWQAGVARMQAHRAQAVQGFLLDIFRANTMDQSDPEKGRHTTAQELLDAGAKHVREKLADSPEVAEQVMDTLADMYFEMGLSDDAAQMRRQRIEVLKLAYGHQDARVADALLSYAEDLSETTDRNRLLTTLNEARSILDARRDSTSPTRGRLLLALTRYYRYVSIGKSRDYADEAVVFFRRGDSVGNLGRALRYAAKTRDALGDYESASKWHQEVIAEARRQHPATGSWLIVPLSELADSQAGLLDIVGAEKSLRTALALGRRFQGDSHLQTLQVQLKLGRFLHDTSRRQEGSKLVHDALDTLRRAGKKAASGELPEVMGFYGSILLAEGQAAEAEPYLAADVDDLRKNYPGSSPLARRLASQGEAFTALGRYSDAEQALTEASRIWQQTGGDVADRAMSNPYLLKQARLALAMGNPQLAIEELQKITPPSNAARLPILLDDAELKIALAQAYLQEDRASEALASAQAALEVVQRSPLRSYYQPLEADALLRVGQAQSRTGLLPAAKVNLELALQLREANDNEMSPRIAEAQIALAQCLLAAGNSQDAQVLAARAAALEDSHTELGAHFRRPLVDLQFQLATQRTLRAHSSGMAHTAITAGPAGRE